MTVRSAFAALVLLGVLAAAGWGLWHWKRESLKKEAAASAAQPEPMEVIAVAAARERVHQRTSTSIGTVIALRSITLKNEIAGTVRDVRLVPGQIVEPGAVLVALDVSVEEAELKAQEAQAALAETVLGRMQRANQTKAVSEVEVDRARAERDVALAQIARTKAVIARKTIRAPFRARVGIADVHAGQYLSEGTVLTTLQGVDDGVHVDFSVNQRVASALKVGDTVDVIVADDAPPIAANVVAIDARVDAVTRNTMVRAKIEGVPGFPGPGSAVRVRTPVGPPRPAVAVPVTALRKGPAGDHVFGLVRDQHGKTRVAMRPVTSGPLLGDEVLILDGLRAGEEVAASGSFKLRDGALVVVVPDQAATRETPSNGGR